MATQLNHMLPQAPDGVKEFMQMGSLTLTSGSIHCNDALSMAYEAWHQQFPFAKIITLSTLH